MNPFENFFYKLLDGYCYDCKTKGLIRWFYKEGQYQHVQCGSFEARVLDTGLINVVDGKVILR